MRLPNPVGCLVFIVVAVVGIILVGLLFPYLLIAAVVMFLLGIG